MRRLGQPGVELLDEVLRAGWIYSNIEKRQERRNRILYRFTQAGFKALQERGVDVDGAMRSNRTFAYGCLDWTERRLHLGGSLGNAVLNSIVSRGIVERTKGTRAMKLVKPISTWIKT